MQIKDYKCRCGHDDFFFMEKQSKGEGEFIGIYCRRCGRWLKWADKNEKNLMYLERR